MAGSLSFNVRQRIADWIYRAQVPERPPVLLRQRRIFIIPSRTGYFFALVLFLLLIASINYTLSLGFLLTFLLAGMAGISMLHTFRNLAQLSISPGRAEAVFAGEVAHFELVLDNPSMPRFALGLKPSQAANAEAEFADVAARGSSTCRIAVPAAQRGILRCGRVEIFTEYPVGLFHAWSYVDFGARCLVYPRPDRGDGNLPLDSHAQGAGTVTIRGDEDFQSLRAYRAGDTPRQIAWKALARGQGLLAKEFGATASADFWLDYDALAGLDRELRLSRLTFWVLEAERLQRPYGLKLPTRSIAPANGATHRDACLEALALFGLDDA